MDKYEIRRLNLRALMDSRCEGKPAALAVKLDRSPSYVSRMLYEEGKASRKRIGEDMVELIERSFGLRKGALDESPGRIRHTSTTPERTQGWSELTRVDATEHRILSLFRSTDARGRAEILAAVEEISARR